MLGNSSRIGGASECVQHPLAPHHVPAIGGRTAMATAHSNPLVCNQCGRSYFGDLSMRRVHRFCGQPCWAAWRKAQPRRHTPQQIRRLRDDEPIPSAVPKRCKARGYIVLRWKVGVRSYVEILEHRYVAGRHMPHVHHKNHDKTDNSPDNLQPLTTLDHGAEHATVNFAEAAELYVNGWSLPRLARRYGVGSGNVLRGLRKRGVKMRTVAESWVVRRGDHAK